MEAERINQLNNHLNDLEQRSAAIRSYMDYQGKKERLEEVIGLSEDPELWNDPKRAQEIGKERKLLEGVVLTLDNIGGGIEDNRMLIEMAVEENDEDGFAAIENDVAELESQMAGLEFKRMFNQPADPNNCFIDITAGAGGTEAEDWAGMLLRMYTRYAERKGFKVEVIEQDDGEIAGINNATLRVEGEYAYGLLRTETGVHRLVRYSPFDSNNKRHTSFASVFVYPEVDDSFEVEINPADLRTDTYRAVAIQPFAARKPPHRHGNAAFQTVRAGNAQAQRRKTSPRRRQGRCRLGQPNPLLCARFFAHQRPAYRL